MKPQTPENEVVYLRKRLEKAEDLIRGLHDGWKKARKAHLETCKNAQAEIDKLRNIAERAIENCECEPECTSHVGDHCNCLRLARNEQIRTELEAINTTDK